jgi:hypothetical protein
MPTSTFSRSLLAAAALALLAGCSGASTSAPLAATAPQGAAARGAQSGVRGGRADLAIVRPGVRAPLSNVAPHFVGNTGAFKGTAWVADLGANDGFGGVYKVSASGKIKTVSAPSGSSWNMPQGVAIDAKGNVYIADTGNSRVVVLNKGGHSIAILQDPGQFPVDVGVAADGTIGVTNLISTSGGSGSVSFYSSLKAKSPTSVATGLFYEDYFGAFDAQDNFYVDGEDASGGIHVGVVASGSTSVTDTGIDTSAYLFPGGVQVIETGKSPKTVQTLTVGDQEALDIYTYALPGYAAGPAVQLGGSGDPVSFAFEKAQKLIATADAENAAVNIFSWPAGGSSPAAVISGFSEPVGIGIDPSGDE